LPRYCSRKQRERVGRRSGEARQDLVVVQPPDLLGALLHDRIAEGYLTVTCEHGTIAVPQREYRGGVDHLSRSLPTREREIN